MPSPRTRPIVYRRTRLAFTLIEVMVVVAIIGILLGFVVIVGSGLSIKSQRTASNALIRSLDVPLQSYKIDNGTFPAETNLTGPTYSAPNSPSDPSYVGASQSLYLALTGKASYTTSVLTGKPYLPLTYNQVGNPAGPSSYIKDSFNYSIGYSTISPNNTTFYDIWSVGGPPSASSGTNAWLTNWQ